LYVSKTCSACASQKKLLGNYTFYFNITDCIDNQEECMNNGITRIPTWIINKEKYTELHTFEELKELTGC